MPTNAEIADENRQLRDAMERMREDLERARGEMVFFAERLEKQDHQYSHGHPQAAIYRARKEALEFERDAAIRRADEAEAREAVRARLVRSWIEEGEDRLRSCPESRCSTCFRSRAVISRLRQLEESAPSPVAAALVELERTMRKVRDARDRHAQEQSVSNAASLVAAWNDAFDALSALDRARGGK